MRALLAGLAACDLAQRRRPILRNSARLHRPCGAPVPGGARPRLANDVTGLRAELLRLARVCGVAHPALVTPDHVELLDGTRSVPASEVFGLRGARALGDEDRRALAAAMA